jgi:hypothetical protein
MPCLAAATAGAARRCPCLLCVHVCLGAPMCKRRVISGCFNRAMPHPGYLERLFKARASCSHPPSPARSRSPSGKCCHDPYFTAAAHHGQATSSPFLVRAYSPPIHRSITAPEACRHQQCPSVSRTIVDPFLHLPCQTSSHPLPGA